MNKFIQNTKLFFYKKPVRIIIALLVIAAIMTGVAFGVIALVNALSDPCEKQPGKEWNKDLKKCVLKECPDDGNLCLTKGSKAGNCIQKDYCDYSGPEGNYYYHKDSCMCKLDCSSLGKEYQGFTKDGSNTVNMNKTTSGWEPNNKLYCGSKCEFSHKNINNYGGEGWCPPLYLCGKEITESGDVIDPGVNCFYNKKYGRCGDSDIICPRPNPNSPPECTSTKEGPRCLEKLCGVSGTKDLNDLSDLSRVPCITNYDCSSDGKSSNFECDHSSNELKSKYFKNVGICKTTDITYTDSKCINNYNAIGEDNYGNAINCNDRTGISNRNKQCKDAINSGELIVKNQKALDISEEKACAKHGICSNGWMAKTSNNSTTSCTGKNATECNLGEPCFYSEGECCEWAVGKQCCNNDIKKFPNCLVTTNLPYDASFLGLGKLGDKIQTPKGTSAKKEMDALNIKLRKSLGVADDDANFKFIDGSKVNGGKENVLYGQCGSVFSGQQQSEFKPGIAQKIGSSGGSTGICLKELDCQGSVTAWKTKSSSISRPGQLGSIPICENESGGEFFWSSSSPEAHNTYMHVTYTGPRCTNPTDNINNTLTSTSGIIDWDFEDPSNPDYKNIAFNMNCNNTDITMFSGNTTKSVKWSNLNNSDTWKQKNLNSSNLTNSGKYISSTSDGGIDPHSKEKIFKVKKCPTDFKKRFNCPDDLQSAEDKRCSDCDPNYGYGYYCPGNIHNYPENMVRSPRRIGSPNTCDGPAPIDNLISHDGQYCNIGYDGECI
jgi:hypothetical protein